MLNSIDIGTSGLIGFSKELQTISSNVANLNTTGFKGSNAQFSAYFSDGGSEAPGQGAQQGAGLGTLPSVVDFSHGQINATGNDLDAAIDGDGFFVLKDSTGQTLYTRDGSFQVDAQGYLVSRSNGARVQGFNSAGILQDINVNGLRTNAAKASANVSFAGTLSTADTTKTVSGITVTDAAGGSHSLVAEFKNNNASSSGSWLVTIKDGGTVVDSGEVHFIAGQLDPGHNSVYFTYNPAGVPAMPLTLTLEAGTTSAATGASTLAVSSSDGYGTGTVSKTTFDAEGKLAISYSNGQTVKDQQLAIALFNSTAPLQPVSGNSFINSNPQSVTLGTAGKRGGPIKAASLEASNVDLSKEFSKIIITQRGYQAASELISTANQMLQTLLQMKGQ
ncbi:flagellar hook protein FlgE [Chitinimonas sp.]|uniref:flagellar hook protein FlgE n=1 Tax=Chitinimonas sp. TaxID=1934313 RepID=UPI0035AEEB8D